MRGNNHHGNNLGRWIKRPFFYLTKLKNSRMIKVEFSLVEQLCWFL